LHDTIPRFDDLRGLLQIRWYGEPHLIDDVEDALPIDNQVPAGQAPSLHNEFFERINEIEDFHGVRKVPMSR